MPTLTLRILAASAFTTKNSALADTEFDNNFIQLKAEVDAVAAALAATSGHTQNTDTILDNGGVNPITAATIKALSDAIAPPVTADRTAILRVNASANTVEYSEQCYGSYFENDNVAETAIAVAGTFEEINCALVEGSVPAVNLSVAANVITYLGTNPAKLKIVWDLSLTKSGGGVADHIDAQITVNGAAQSGHFTRDSNNAELGNMGGSWIITVENGWDINLQITNADSTSNVNVSDQLISIEKIH